MNIYIASDHAGFELKNHLSEYIKNLGFTVIDKGPLSYDPDDDYPDFVTLVANEVLKEPHSSRGVVIGGSGQGEAMAVNRFRGIRAAVFYGGPQDILTLSRKHNDSNILSLGARFLAPHEAEVAVKLWLETDFTEDERHKRRLLKIDENNG